MSQKHNPTFTGATIKKLKAYNQSEILGLYISKTSIPASLYAAVNNSLQSLMHRDLPFREKISFMVDMEKICKTATYEMLGSLQKHWHDTSLEHTELIKTTWPILDESQVTIKKTLEKEYRVTRAQKKSRAGQTSIPLLNISLPQKNKLQTGNIIAYKQVTVTTKPRASSIKSSYPIKPTPTTQKSKDIGPTVKPKTDRTLPSVKTITSLSTVDKVIPLNMTEQPCTSKGKHDNISNKLQSKIARLGYTNNISGVKRPSTLATIQLAKKQKITNQHGTVDHDQNITDWTCHSQSLSDMELLNSDLPDSNPKLNKQKRDLGDQANTPNSTNITQVKTCENPLIPSKGTNTNTESLKRLLQGLKELNNKTE